jgi:hypothetical protein
LSLLLKKLPRSMYRSIWKRTRKNNVSYYQALGFECLDASSSRLMNCPSGAWSGGRKMEEHPND